MGAESSEKGRPGRAPGLSYQDMLAGDSKPVPETLRGESSQAPTSWYVPRDRYFSRDYHDLEVERLWRRVWQMACREEEIPEVGDHVVYEVGDLSILVVRSEAERIRAFHNTCLHRGRRLRDDAGNMQKIRCPFHGWTWELDGSLSRIPCRWDFPEVRDEDYRLPELQVGRWGGFVFVNPDAEAEPLDAFLGDLSHHFERWPLEARYIKAHVARVLPCNWKVAQEAFMESYHVVSTHPQLLPSFNDTGSQYDVFGNWSRAISPSGTPSPQLQRDYSEQEIIDWMTYRYEDQPSSFRISDGLTARQVYAKVMRASLQPLVPGAADLSDTEVCDFMFYTLFPNFHPWGGYSPICYRFRPYENDPERSIMEVYQLHPFRGKRPKPAPVHWLAIDEPWTEAPELGLLARIFEQDMANLAHVQRGLRASARPGVTFANYQEVKIRHFHDLLDRYLGA